MEHTDLLTLERHWIMPTVRDTAIGSRTVPAVDARALHKALDSQQRFTDWIRNRIRQYGFQEGEDFKAFHRTMKSHKNSTLRKEYLLTIHMGKELAMVERTDRGRLVRKYFIAMEERGLKAAAQEYDRAKLEGARGMAALMNRARYTGLGSKFINGLIRYRRMGLSQREAAKLLDSSRSTVQEYESLLRKCGYTFEVADPGSANRNYLEAR